MKRKLLSIVLAVAFLVGMVASPAAADDDFSWHILYPEAVTVGEPVTVTIDLSTDDPIDLHVSFKGEFSPDEGNYWSGHWTYQEQVVALEAGDHEDLEFTFAIPYSLYVEALAGTDGGSYRFLAQNYYFYVFSTTPGGSWGTGSENKGPLYLPGEAALSTETVIYPAADGQALLISAVSMMLYKVLSPSSDLDEGLRQSLVAKLYGASVMIDKAYASGKLNQLNGAQGKLSAFINQLEHGPAARFSKAGECIDLTTFAVSWID